MAKTAAERAREYRANRKSEAPGLDSRESAYVAHLEAEVAFLRGLVAALTGVTPTVTIVTSRDGDRDAKRDDRDVTDPGVARTPDPSLSSVSLEKDTESPSSLRSEPPQGSAVTKSVTKRHDVTSRQTACPASDATPEELAAWVDRWKLEQATGEEFAKFLDHHRARRSLFADWRAAWRNWQRNAAKFESTPRLKLSPPPPRGPTSDGLDPMSWEASQRRKQRERQENDEAVRDELARRRGQSEPQKLGGSQR